MAENDPRENTSKVKTGQTRKPTPPKPRTLHVDLDGPLYEPDRWYTVEYLRVKRLRCSKQTWARYRAAGLKIYRPGTKSELVWSTDLDPILRIPESELPPPYRSPYAQKNKARKRKEG